MWWRRSSDHKVPNVKMMRSQIMIKGKLKMEQGLSLSIYYFNLNHHLICILNFLSCFIFFPHHFCLPSTHIPKIGSRSLIIHYYVKKKKKNDIIRKVFNFDYYRKQNIRCIKSQVTDVKKENLFLNYGLSNYWKKCLVQMKRKKCEK